MSSDWLSRSRQDQLNMALVWNSVLNDRGSYWGIPVAAVTEFSGLVSAAEAALAAAQNESTRTPVTTERCREAFTALVDKMRFIKNHYFLIPPLDNTDIVSLGLRPRDTNPSPVPPPAGFAEADVSYPGVGALELHCRPVAGQAPLDPRSDYGYRVYYGVLPPGGATTEAATGPKRELVKAPLTGADLPHSQWVRRKKERFYFNGDSGKTAYFCIQYENSKGDVGPWGPLFQAVIP